MKTPIETLLDRVEWTAYEQQQRVSDDGIPVATHHGTLTFYDLSLKVYKLSNGQRVIDSEDVRRFFGFGDNAAGTVDTTVELGEGE